jgi:hypothetical protein
MNYTELTANIEDVCESTFTADQLAMFVQQAEQTIYSTVQLPALRKNTSDNLTTSSQYFSTPTDHLFPYSLAVVDGDGKYHFLLNKDVNFIREAYPDPTSEGLPKHYALVDEDRFVLGPTPDDAYEVHLQYGYHPESIVTAGTTWLGDEFDSALLNGALVQAIRFMKGEPDVVQMYEKLYVQAIKLLKNLGDGKLRQDSYRSGQVRNPIV